MVSNLLLGVSANLIVVALVFFVVEQFFQFRTEERIISQIRVAIKSELSQWERSIPVTLDRSELFQISREILERERWSDLKIFAPVGLWKPNSEKYYWFEAIANCAKSGSVERVEAVFGLPPMRKDDMDVKPEEIEVNLKHAFFMLKKFDRILDFTIRYYPPAEASVGVGALIFSKRNSTGMIALAYSRNSGEVVDSGFTLADESVFELVNEWFDKRIFGKVTQSFVLQSENSSLLDNWENTVELWYGEDYSNLDWNDYSYQPEGHAI